MKARHWLLAGFGCIAVGVLMGVLTAVTWMGRLRAFADGGAGTTDADPLQNLTPLIAAGGIAGLLLCAGSIVVVMAFIQQAKEPHIREPRPRL